MKTRIPLIFVCFLGLFGCQKEESQVSREILDRADSENAALRSSLRQLEMEKAQRDQLLVERTETLIQILDQLENLTSDGLEIRALTSQLREYGHEDVQITRDVQSKIAAIERRLAQARNFEAELQDQLDTQRVAKDELDAVVKRYQNSLDQKTQEIHQLKTQFVEVAAELDLLKTLNADLQVLAATQGVRIGNLESQVVDMEERLTAFVLAGSSSDLSRMRRDGVIRRRLGRLEPDPEILSRNMFESHFQSVDASRTRLVIPGNMTKLRIRSIHSKYEEMYSVAKVPNGFAIELNQPEQFWQLSRFLIIEAK